jgi:methyl-accepting chemotaxis protein
VVDFPKGMTEAQRNRLEEALMSMGILDALIVDTEDFSKIKALDSGICDRYILTDVKGVSSNLSEFMEIVNEESDILFYQRAVKALGAVGFDAAGDEHTVIYEDGHYRLGALTGTTTGTYQGKFIGVKARREYREQKIRELSAQLAVLLEEQQVIKERIKEMDQHLDRLKMQWEQFPDGGDLKVAIQTLAEARQHLERIRKELEQLQMLLDEQLKQLGELRQEIRKICEKVYLPPHLEVFQIAREEVEQYRQDLHELELTHHRYLTAHVTARDVQEQMESIDEDLDVILGDIRDLHAVGKKIAQRLHSVAEQLVLTDAAGIEEKIALAVSRIRAIPGELQDCAGRIATLGGQVKNACEERSRRTESMLVLRKQCQMLKDAVLSEARLGYYSEIVTGMLGEGVIAAEKIADHVFRNEESLIGSRDRNGLTSDLQEAYFENRGMLAEYSPVLNEILKEESDGVVVDVQMSRLELRTRYRGISMNFQEFLKGVEQDIEEKMSLLGDKERELFEDILLGVINRKIRGKIYGSETWVEGMNKLMS